MEIEFKMKVGNLKVGDRVKTSYSSSKNCVLGTGVEVKNNLFLNISEYPRV